MNCSRERDEVGESTGGEISEAECVEDDWLEVGHGRDYSTLSW